ncbi:hypothetical protein ACFV2I_36995 [Streptomyces microflavus]|uniref:hypothetical protein n=1 Tax=Streptomyces microflavus TaxID=1919 RepID=UPI00367BD281
MAKRRYSANDRQSNIAVILTTAIVGGATVFCGWAAEVTYWYSIPIGIFVSICTFFCSIAILLGSPSPSTSAAEDDAIETLKRTDPQVGILLEFNRQQVLRYHHIVTKQADHSFRAGQAAAASGLIVMGICLWVGLNQPGADVKWFSGAIAAVGATVSGYINRTYMRMYEKSIQQLSQYFDQPVVTGYYLTAERMAKAFESSEDSRNAIISSVLSSAAHITKRSSSSSAGNEETPKKQRMRKTKKPARE